MVNNKFFCVFIIFLSSLLITTTIFADSFKTWNSSRDYEPIVLKADPYFGDFIGNSVYHIFAYSYKSIENKWIQIPLQIDEQDDSSHVWVPTPNRILNNNDRLIFMARDMGDEASEAYIWIDDEDSKSQVRYVITASDPQNPGQVGYVYFYLSTTLQDTCQINYINYVPPASGTGADTIRGVTYVEGHSVTGIPDYWELPVEAGGSGVDLLDRQKARVTSAILGIPLDLTEENLTTPRIEAVVGKIRVARRIWFVAEIYGLPIADVDIPMYYYPYSIDSKGASGTLQPDYKVNHIRQSFDLANNASGMLFYNNNNNNIIVDGKPDNIITDLVFNPDVNWYMFTGDQGTILTLTRLDQLGTTSLYYYDNSSGGTGDGKIDTGDMQSWGDIGIVSTGTALQGRFSIAYLNYFLPKNQQSTIGPEYAANFKNPLTIYGVSEEYVPVTEVAVSLPDTSASAGSTTYVPVLIADVSGLNITAVQFSIIYDTSILDAVDLSSVGTISDSWGTPSFTKTATGVDVVLAGTEPLVGSGELVKIGFHAIGNASQITSLQFENVVFTPGNVVATPTNGSFEVEPAQVFISLPTDAKGMQGATISIPVTISNVAGLGIVAVNMMISYDPNVLNAFSISTENTIASSWPAPTFNDFSNRAQIIMNSTAPLEGEGPLVYINFNIIGDDKTTSSLHFMSAVVNNGTVNVIKNDGLFTVDGVIPVELASFNATTAKGDVFLTWTTVSESNNYGFEVYRKNQTNAYWDKIGFVEGHGTANVPYSYSYTDHSLTPGIYSYRLKQIDFDGTFEFSYVIEVTIVTPATFALDQNYPNPFNPFTTIKYQIPETASKGVMVNLTIYNLLGFKIKTLVSTEHLPGFYIVSWNGKDDNGNTMPAGMYVYRLRAGENVATRRMVLMK